jgi:predicted RNase H-like HicB family nuclease
MMFPRLIGWPVSSYDKIRYFTVPDAIVNSSAPRVTGETLPATEQAIREAIEFHLDGLREDGNPIPPLSSHVEYVEVAA